MESNLLLCCINNSSGYDSITNEAIHQIFGVFGRVLDIYIFSRSTQAKAFIKYESQESFHRALAELNNSNTHLGHVRVYSSKKTEIIRKPGDDSEGHDSEKLSPVSERPSLQPSDRPAFPTTSGLDTPRSKHSIAPTNNESNRDSRAALSRRLLPDSFSFTPRGSNPTSQSVMPRSSLFRAGEILCYEPSRTRVLFVENINADMVQRLRPKFLANVFGCFGNVTAVFMNPSLEQALVEFQDEDQAESALRSLHSIVFFNSPLKLSYSDLDALSADTLSAQSDGVFFQNDPKAFRYTPDHSIRVNELSALLHVTGVPEAVTPLILFELIGQLHEPTKMAQLKRNSKGFRMFLLQFESIEQSLEVLAVMHNKQINEKFVKISFSHAKID
jgi:hypothetical protein